MTRKNVKNEKLVEEINDLIDPPIDQLVNREKQIELFATTLQNFQTGREKRFLEWSGSPGIGKTQLARLLIEKVCRPQGTPYIFLNFNTQKARAWGDDPVLLLLHIAEILRLDISALQGAVDLFRQNVPPSILEAYLTMPRQQRLYERPEWLKRLHKVRDEFLVALDQTQKANGNWPVIFFFDETEYADPDLVTWLEEWVFSPLMQADQYVIVWTARRQHRWARPEVQRQILREQLQPFSKDEARDQFKASEIEPDLIDQFFQEALSITGGHPAANAVVITHMQDDTSALIGEEDKSLEIELLKTIYEQFVRGRVLYGLRQEEKLACELLSMARFFDAFILRRVLLRFNENLFAKWSPVDFRILFERLKETQLLVWQNGFAVDPDFRNIIRDYYRVCKPDVFSQINEELVAIHKEWLERPVDNRSFFIMELLYHLVSLRQVGKKVQLKSALEKQLRKYLSINDPAALRMALQTLAGEIENNTDDWLTDQQRKLLIKTTDQFEQDIQNQQTTIDSAGMSVVEVTNIELLV
ncbi:MAG TPA: ATP-binding protein [Cyclobacteriaceae bacterium]|nr:ATP-binding protein [Cyclobacteriaceae bacterium]